MDISIIIPVHNGGQDFRLCLTGVSNAKPAPYEVIVVADGCTDGSIQTAQEFGARLIELSQPEGPARARNLGAQNARGDILFFVDADVVIPENAVQQICDVFLNEPGLSAAFGSYDDTPAKANFLSQYKNLFHHFVHQTGNREASTFWGACGAIRSEVFEKIGGFNETYPDPSIEDIELGYRLKENGYRIRLLKDLMVKHLKRWDIVSLLRTDVFKRALPWTRLIMQRGRFVDDLNLKVSARISIVCAYVLLLTLLGAMYYSEFFVLSAFSVVLLFGLNFKLYHFFFAKHGVIFSLKAMVWHWLYLVYCGLAFMIGVTLYHLKK